MITLSSDFGTPYPAAMRGVILSRTDARLVDISHSFPRQDIRASAFWLREILPYFPPAVHLVVVDPGVGTDRAALVVRAGDHALVGPDNGVLMPAARELADSLEWFRIVESEDSAADGWPPSPSSSTFHGRDLFAPAAARVHERGIGSFAETEGFEPVDSVVALQLPTPTVRESGASGEVLAVDRFGNVITNVPGEVLAGREEIVANETRTPVRRTYAECSPGERLVTVGSHGNVELAVNRGRGDRVFDLVTGERVELEW